MSALSTCNVLLSWLQHHGTVKGSCDKGMGSYHLHDTRSGVNHGISMLIYHTLFTHAVVLVHESCAFHFSAYSPQNIHYC